MIKDKDRVRAIVFILLFGFTLLCQAKPANTQLTQVQIVPSPDLTRVALSLTDKTTFKVFTLNNPERIVIDLAATKNLAGMRDIPLADTPIRALRSGPQAGNGLRVVIDLTKSVQYNAYLQQNDSASPQLIVDLKEVTSANVVHGTALSMLEPRHTPPPAAIPAEPPPDTITKFNDSNAKISLSANNDKQRDIVVVIDPGHGGKDPGARGAGGTHEKDVVLAIAQALQRNINQQPGFHAFLTRDSDYYIPLRDRLEIARKDRGDMFVAIHADAFHNSYSMGSSVFALSARGASSEAARWLAEKENYSELGTTNLDDKNDMLRSVLINLEQNYSIGASLQLGGVILSELGKFTRLHHPQVEQAGFVVLKSPDIPSILIETGFISNPREEDRLSSPAYQNRLAEAITQGISHYFWRNPPPGTLLATERAKEKKNGTELSFANEARITMDTKAEKAS